MSPMLPLLISGPCTRIPSEHLQATWMCELKVESINRYCMQLKISAHTTDGYAVDQLLQWDKFILELSS